MDPHPFSTPERAVTPDQQPGTPFSFCPLLTGDISSHTLLTKHSGKEGVNAVGSQGALTEQQETEILDSQPSLERVRDHRLSVGFLSQAGTSVTWH